MADLLIPVANHLFTPDALKSAVDKAVSLNPDKANHLVGTVDANGAKVVLVIGNKGTVDKPAWALQTAFSKGWDGSSAFGASGSIAW